MVTGAATVSVTFTPSAPSGFGAIFGGCPDDFSGDLTISSMQLDGVDMDPEVSSTGDSFITVRGYSLNSTGTGSRTATVVLTENASFGLAAFSIAGGDTSDSVSSGNTASTNASTQNTDYTCPSVSGEVVFAALAGFTGTGTWVADGPTKVNEKTIGGAGVRFGYGYIASSGNPQAFNGDWFNSSPGGWASVAMSFKEAAAGGSVVQSGGASTVTAASAKLDAQPVSAAGTSTVVAVGQSTNPATITAAGAAAAAILGSAQAAAPVSIAGAATVNIVGNASAAGQTAASSAGAATVNIVGASLAAADIKAAGEADVRVAGVPTDMGNDYLLWGSRLREDGRRRRQIEADDAELIRIVRVELGPKLLARARRRTVN